MSCIYDCGGLLSSFDQSGRDRDLVVAGGQTVLSIVKYEDGICIPRQQIRLGRKLDHSISQLAWNHSFHEDIIGIASPNGKLFEARVLPDGQIKRNQLVDPEHQQGTSGLNKRLISRVRFHSTESLIFSSSHDGQVRGFDLRSERSLVSRLPYQKPDNTILHKCYDFQLDRSGGNYVYAIYDNGTVTVWDWRMCKSIENILLAPGQPLFSIDLHPSSRRFAAISSRDTSIHLHNFESRENSFLPNLSIRVPSVTGRLEWRPNRAEQFASCSVTPDQLIYVWDARRPYIPFATFDGHHKVVDVQWRRDDEHTLIAADNYEPAADEKHGYMIWHRFRSSENSTTPANGAYTAKMNRLSETFCSSVLTLSNSGDVMYVQSNNRDHLNNETPSSNNTVVQQNAPILTTTNQIPRARFAMNRGLYNIHSTNQIADMINGPGGPSRPSETFLNPTSKITCFACPEIANSLTTIRTMAHEYRLSGASVAQLCSHNAAVAIRCQRHDIARAWELIAITAAGSTNPFKFSFLPKGQQVVENSESSETMGPNNNVSGKHAFAAKIERQMSFGGSTTAGNRGFGRSISQTVGDQESGHGAGICHGTTTDSDGEGTVTLDLDALVAMSDGVNIDQQFMPDDDAHLIIPAELGPSTSTNLHRRLLKNSNHNVEFQVGSVIDDRRRSFDGKLGFRMSSESTQTNESSSTVTPRGGKSTVKLEEVLLSVSSELRTGSMFGVEEFDWSSPIVDMIEAFANANDVQNALAMMVVASSLLSIPPEGHCAIPPETQRFWFEEYVNLLSKLQLVCPLGKLLNASTNFSAPTLTPIMEKAQQLSLTDTTYSPLCHMCDDRVMADTSNNMGPVCRRCKRMPAICSVCSRPVRGLYAWCRVCFHGGHLVHFKAWFSEAKKSGIRVKCPSGGCEHSCVLFDDSIENNS